MLGWWVYENTLHDKAIIHYWKCSHCNNGKGKTGKSSGKFDLWHGPYDTIDEVKEKTIQLRKSETRICSFCKKLL